MIDNFTVIIEAETDLLEISKVQEEYERAMDSFDSYRFIRKPDFTQDLTEITILGNFNPVVWERYGVKSNIGSSNSLKFNRYRRKGPTVDASIFDSALSHTRRSDASKKREEKSVVALRSLLNVFACGQVSSPRLYRLNFQQRKNLSRLSHTLN